MIDFRQRKRNSKKNRSAHAKTSSARQRPVTAGDFDSLKRGSWKWRKDQ